MTRSHYIVRVGNEGIAQKVTLSSANHWHYLSPQLLWGLPKQLKQVNVRDQFESDIADPRVTTYIWFLCNGHKGSGHFVQVAIGRHRLARGPVQNGPLPIPDDMMERLREGFDHWFDWWPLNPDPGFEDRVRQVPIPKPPYRASLQRVTVDHQSLQTFENFVDDEEERQRQQNQHQPQMPRVNAAMGAPVAVMAPTSPYDETQLSRIQEIAEEDLQNIKREFTNPHGPGFCYLIHMSTTNFYKIGMSLDPETRLKTLQTGNPLLLTLLETQDVNDMRSTELTLHRYFESHRVLNSSVREWFDFGEDRDEVKAAFAELARVKTEIYSHNTAAIGE